MTNWSVFNNKNILTSETPYISGVEGTALIDQLSEVKISGLKFKPDSQIVCDAGNISNIRISPEEIIFNILATTPGSFPIEVKNNNNQSSNDWNSLSVPVLIARNPLNLTNGWLDFRSVDSTTLGNVTSHVNQSLSTNKAFSNSGFSLDSSRGLIFNGTGTTNSYNNYIQFNSFLFPLEACKFEIITISNSSNINRIRICTGLTSSINSIENAIDINSNALIYSYRFGEYSSPTTATIRADSSFPLDSTNLVKFTWDFTKKLFSVYKLNGLSDLDSGDLKFKFPLDLFKNGFPSRLIPTGIIPLFQFFNSGSLSSIVAMRII